MREIRLQAVVDEDHTARLRLPEDVRKGPIEVIVLVREDPAPARELPLGELLQRLAIGPWTGRTQEDLDLQIQGERGSWDREGSNSSPTHH